MSFYIEPVYLNEKMVLNCAAYVFKGVSMESDVSEGSTTQNKGGLKLGFKFLNELISPVSLSADTQKEKSITTKTARRYTLGGLHMTLIDELNERGDIQKIENVSQNCSDDKFIEIEVVLKPIDFYSILVALKVTTPLIIQVLQNFGDRINHAIFNKNIKSDLIKYESLIKNVLSELESDYLKSGQLEMIMHHPISGEQLGVVDIDVSDMDALAVKAKLTDGKFKVIGRVSRQILNGESMSLVQRTVLSSVLGIAEKLAGAGGQVDKYRTSMDSIKNITQQVCQLSLKGPAMRIMVMSICI